MAVLWVHSGGWLSQAAISYIGVHNGLSFAEIGQQSHLLMPAKDQDEQLSAHLMDYYGVAAPDNLDVHLVSLKRRWWNLHNPYYEYALQYALALRRRLPPLEPLVVLTREPRFLPFLAKLSQKKGVVGLYESHYFYYDLSWRGDPISHGDRARSKLERRYLPKISGVVAIASEQARLFAAALPTTPILFSPLGAKSLPVELTSLNRENAWRQRRTIAYIGHLFAYKGVDALVAHGARLKEKNINAVIFGGTEAEVAKYRQMSADKGADNLSWHPFLPPAKMFAALADTASAGGVALHDCYYNRYLTCPGKTLDFLSLGLPVVASDLPCTRDVLADAGIYSPPGRMDDMVEQVERLLDDPEAYVTMARAAKQRGATLAWPHRAQHILDFAAGLVAT